MNASKLTNIQPKRILVITQRYLGDTLLITPLLSSLKQAYPDSKIDVLLPKSNFGMLEGNPDINQLIALSKGWNLGKLLVSFFRTYDLAISTQASDRTALCSLLSGKVSISFVTEDLKKTWWKRYLLTAYLTFSNQYQHAVLENLRFCELLGIKPIYKITPPQEKISTIEIPKTPYAILHIMPQWRYKQWHLQGWQQIAEFLSSKNYQVILTGSNNPDELNILVKLQQSTPTPIVNLAGKLSLAQVTKLISHANLFIGPDTGITHLAAATGTPTIAIFGPTDPYKWSPWPYNYAKSQAPFSSHGCQQQKNVYLIQGSVTDKHCVPCQGEGCEKNRNSYSECLDSLEADKVTNIISIINNEKYINNKI